MVVLGKGGVGTLLLLALLSASAATLVDPSSAATATLQQVLGREALHVLFGDSDGSTRSLLQQPNSAISYQTLRVVEHPLRSDMSQKKVQQTHAGLELFGHTFVIGLAADGVTEQAEGTFGTVFTGLEEAIPDTTPKLEPAAALEVAASATEGVALASKLIIWVEKEDGNVAHNAHLAYLVTLSITSGPAPEVRTQALVDAKTGAVLRTWSRMPTRPAPGPRPRPDASNPNLQPTSTPTTAPVIPPPLASMQDSSSRSHVEEPAGSSLRGLQQTTGRVIIVWAIGGNTKVGPIYYNGTNGGLQLQVTRTGNACSFISNFAKTGDLSQVYTAEQLQAHAYRNFTAAADDAWFSLNLTRVRALYDAVPPVTYPCPSQRQYIKTTDAVKGSYSQQADVQTLMSAVFLMWKYWIKVDVAREFAAAGVPMPLLVLPHADPALDNMYWTSFYLLCGDGDVTFYPLCTSGDLLAHELTHGVTQIINGELLYYGQPGGWNEGFSDFAAMTYSFYSTGRVDPAIGAAITLNAPCLRNMSDPGMFNQVSSVLDLTTKDPHDLSGVPNLAFYRLATSPCYDPKVAMLVAQRAAHLYFTPTTSFLDGANAWVRAARDLGYSTTPVRAAWQSVGLWQACGKKGGDVDAGTFLNPDPDQFERTSFFGPANTSVYIGNVSYAYLSRTGALERQPCGLSFSITLLDSGVLPAYARPNLYVGINHIPDPVAGIYDCSVDMSSVTGPTLPSCDVPVVANATYHLVARNSRVWSNQAFSWHLWGPVVGDDTSATVLPGPGEPATALKCFIGGTCTSDGGCSSGSCSQGYCAAKASGRRSAAARRALGEP